MAIGKSFLGLKRGSTKSTTYQVLNGMQVVKDRVYDVKNPRTYQQMVQRMVMATASAAYSAMREIADHSFEGVTYGQNSMSEFIKQNAKLIRADLEAVSSSFGHNKYQDRNLVPGCYIISKGSLTPLTFAPTISSGDGTLTIVVAGATAAGAAPTANELAKYLGLSVGEMATICMIYKNQAANGHNFSFVRIKSIAEGTVVLTTANFGTFFELESSIGTPTLTVTATGFSLLYDADINDASVVQRAIIYSQKSANGWMRSTAKFNAPSGIVFAPTYAEAMGTYPVGKQFILNGGKI